MLRNRTTSTAQPAKIRLRTRLANYPALLLVFSLTALTGAAMYFGAGPVQSKTTIVVQAAGDGKGLLNPQDGRQLKVQNSDPALEAAMRSGSARPLVLAKGDFDGDGAPDLVTGYRYFGSGILTLQRGNIEAFAPRDLKVYDRAAKGELPASFLTDVQTIQLPESPDFLLVGDF